MNKIVLARIAGETLANANGRSALRDLNNQGLRRSSGHIDALHSL